MKKFVNLFFTSLLSFSSTLLHGAYGEKLPLQQIMTEQDAQDIGVDRLTPEQQEALERWAANWTHHVLAQAPTYRPGENLSLWVQSWPSYANPIQTELTPDETKMRQLSNQVIDTIGNNGEYIGLKDGSSWHIGPTYRFLTQNWLKGQVVEIKQSQNERHPWSLHNLAMDQIVEADMSKPASPSGQKPNEPPQYYAGSVQLQNVTLQGDSVSLADGSSWRIAPTDMYKAKSWSANDRIRVEPSDNSLYIYKLTNLDTGEIALANKKQ